MFVQDGNVSGEDISDVDWTTDDESEVNIGNEEVEQHFVLKALKIVNYGLVKNSLVNMGYMFIHIISVSVKW